MSVKAKAPRLQSPVVALGPETDVVRDGCFGVLLGVRRAAWIDVVRVRPVAGEGGLSSAIDARFEAHTPWDAVGVALPHAATRGKTRVLLEALVPGDVLATEREVRFHAGDRFARARLDPSR